MNRSIPASAALVPAIFNSLLFFLYLATSATVSAETAKVNIVYKGSGSASFEEDYLSGSSTNQCRRDHSVVRETVNGILWEVKWNLPVRPVLQQKPTQAQFSGTMNVSAESFADMSACPGSLLNSCKAEEPHCVLFSDSCDAATLSYLDTFHAGLSIKKSGKGYIVSLEGEKELQGNNAAAPTPAPNVAPATAFSNSSSLCLGSSIFDNAVVQGLGDISVTGAKIKLTPAEKSTRTVLKVKLQKEYDCKDPAKVLYGLGTSCSLKTDFSGTISVKGKWKAKLVLK